MKREGAEQKYALVLAKAAKKSAYKQGLAGLPMYGEALRASNCIEMSTGMYFNTFYSEYQRGWRERLAK
jgi:hypothetical protein